MLDGDLMTEYRRYTAFAKPAHVDHLIRLREHRNVRIAEKDLDGAIW